MNDNQGLEMDDQDTRLGKVEIAPEVIEVIAGIAAAEIEGVAAMRGNFATGVAERLGRKSHGKGVKVDLTDQGIVLDVFVVIAYGYSIPYVAQQIQENIRQELHNMTALEAEKINIHVVGIQFDQTKQDEDIDRIGE